MAFREKKFLPTLQRFDLALKQFPRKFPARLFAESGAGSLQDRFALYAGGYSVRTREALEEMYPRLKSWMGEDLWLDLGARYQDTAPSTSYNLGNVGLKLPAFLKRNGYDLWWYEIARFERQILKSFHSGRGREAFSLKDVALFADKTKLDVRPSAFLWRSSFSLVEAWQKDDRELISRKKEFAVIYRKNFVTNAIIISESEWRVLTALKSGSSLGQALSKTRQSLIADELSQWIQKWQSLEIFSLRPSRISRGR